MSLAAFAFTRKRNNVSSSKPGFTRFASRRLQRRKKNRACFIRVDRSTFFHRSTRVARAHHRYCHIDNFVVRCFPSTMGQMYFRTVCSVGRERKSERGVSIPLRICISRKSGPKLPRKLARIIFLDGDIIIKRFQSLRMLEKRSRNLVDLPINVSFKSYKIHCSQLLDI